MDVRVQASASVHEKAAFKEKLLQFQNNPAYPSVFNDNLPKVWRNGMKNGVNKHVYSGPENGKLGLNVDQKYLLEKYGEINSYTKRGEINNYTKLGEINNYTGQYSVPVDRGTNKETHLSDSVVTESHVSSSDSPDLSEVCDLNDVTVELWPEFCRSINTCSTREDFTCPIPAVPPCHSTDKGKGGDINTPSAQNKYVYVPDRYKGHVKESVQNRYLNVPARYEKETKECAQNRYLNVQATYEGHVRESVNQTRLDTTYVTDVKGHPHSPIGTESLVFDDHFTRGDNCDNQPRLNYEPEGQIGQPEGQTRVGVEWAPHSEPAESGIAESLSSGEHGRDPGALGEEDPDPEDEFYVVILYPNTKAKVSLTTESDKGGPSASSVVTSSDNSQNLPGLSDKPGNFWTRNTENAPIFSPEREKLYEPDNDEIEPSLVESAEVTASEDFAPCHWDWYYTESLPREKSRGAIREPKEEYLCSEFVREVWKLCHVDENELESNSDPKSPMEGETAENSEGSSSQGPTYEWISEVPSDLENLDYDLDLDSSMSLTFDLSMDQSLEDITDEWCTGQVDVGGNLNIDHKITNTGITLADCMSQMKWNHYGKSGGNPKVIVKIPKYR